MRQANGATKGNDASISSVTSWVGVAARKASRNAVQVAKRWLGSSSNARATTGRSSGGKKSRSILPEPAAPFVRFADNGGRR